jgi:hypothetical protein
MLFSQTLIASPAQVKPGDLHLPGRTVRLEDSRPQESAQGPAARRTGRGQCTFVELDWGHTRAAIRAIWVEGEARGAG